MFIPIFCMFMLGAGIGQASQGATDGAKAALAAGRVFEVVDRVSKIDHSSDVPPRCPCPPPSLLLALSPASKGVGLQVQG